MRALRYIAAITPFLLTCTAKKSERPLHDRATLYLGFVYTCSMHPSIVSDKPGRCPICGMGLVKNPASADNTLTLSERQKKLANISTQKVSLKSIGHTVVVGGRLVVDEERTEAISSRVSGRIEKLFMKETGRYVRQGEPLYELYSEPLSTMQREFLLAKEQYETLGKTQTRYELFFKAAEKKLLLYGLSPKQVKQLADLKSITERITFLAPASGMVSKVNVSEGEYVNEGAVLYRIENISQLWIEAELYSNEWSLIKMGDTINVLVNGFESAPVQAVVTFMSHAYNPNTQSALMRAALSNSGIKFKPGMQAQVLFTHSTRKAIAVPADAVIRSDKGGVVYVQADSSSFRPRRVKTGIEDFEHVEITDGLTEGEIVVVSGAYLLYSESVLKRGSSSGEGPNP